MKFSFYGHFEARLQNFIAQKQSLGFSYQESSRILSRFATMCAEEFPDERSLTKKLCNHWATLGEAETTTFFRARLTPVREFARYLLQIGEDAYVLPHNYTRKPQQPLPYICPLKEIAQLWSLLDGVRPIMQTPVRHLVLPAIFRVLYCCGLRPHEARCLRTGDVDLTSGRLNILASKKHADRIVMMADDLTQYCRKYDAALELLVPNRKYFFAKPNGEMYTKTWFSSTFRVYWALAHPNQSAINMPRLYDFRHSFATHRLYQWMGEGRDLTAMLPYLSAYMGHAHLSSTYYYIHFVPEQLKVMSGLDFSKYEALLPEVSGDE